MKILVIEALGLHLGYLGCYGNDWVGTPNLDRLAAEGIVFDAHIVDQPELRAETPFASRSVGTGRYVLSDGSTKASAWRAPQIARHDSLTTFTADSNPALTWIEGPSLLPPWNLDDDLLDAYFDEDDVEEGLRPWRDPPLEIATLDDAHIVRLQNTYAAVVTVFDAQLGALLDGLPLDETMVCVTARSGLPLGEHGMIGAPRPALHDELVHVPLLMRLPKAAFAGTRIAALTQPIDVPPTFLEALGAPIPPMDGRSLWPLIRGEADAIRPHALAAMRVAEQECWLLRTPDAALHLPIAPADAPPRLFLKPEDRWEVNDLYQQQIDLAEEMEKTLRNPLGAIRQG